MSAVWLLQRCEDPGGQQQYGVAQFDFHDTVYWDDFGAGAVCGQGAYAGSEWKAVCEIEIKNSKEIKIMEAKDILKHVDHTLLTQGATWAEIKQICDDAVEYGTASVCIPPSYVKQAKEYVQDKMAVCTVIGFPNGYMTTKAKEFETKDALANGADEIDMVINIGWVKDGKFDCVEEEIRTLKAACGDKVLKVIIETCLLTEEEKVKMCQVVTSAGADYIKTSTGFSKAGATFADIELFSKNIGPDVKMKAAGGISSMEDAEKFLELGADRLGTSRIIKLVKNQEASGY